MFQLSANRASFFSDLIAIVIFWLYLAGIGAAHTNSSLFSRSRRRF